MGVRKEKESRTASLLRKIYTSPSQPGSFSGVNALYRAALRKNTNKRIKLTKDKVKDFLEGQKIYTTHKLPRVNFTRRRVMVSGPFEQWQADLADMSKFGRENRGYNWILLAVDVFSKKLFAVPVKSKSTESMVDAFKQLLQDVPDNQLPKKIQTDKGKEFVSRGVIAFLRTKNIQHFSSEDDYTKACIAERTIRTLKEKMYKGFAAQGNYKWLELLPQLVRSINQTYHSAIKMTPEEANVSQPERVAVVGNNLYGPKGRYGTKMDKELHSNRTPVYKVGDFVRLRKTKHVFSKKHMQNYTEEVFKVVEVINTNPLSYKIEDLRQTPIKGAFNGYDMINVKKPQDFEIEKIISRRGDQVLVKWKGYGDDFNQWIHKKDVRKNKRN